MDLFGNKKVARLESIIDDYKGLNSALEAEVKELREFKLKYNIAKMLLDDDPAIDELLECKKRNVEDDNKAYVAMMQRRGFSGLAGQLGGMAGGQQSMINAWSSSSGGQQAHFDRYYLLNDPNL